MRRVSMRIYAEVKYVDTGESLRGAALFANIAFA
jgi:hypothetical protein